MLVKEIEKDTHRILDYFLGSDTSWAVAHGYKKVDCEQAYNGDWYEKGYVPAKPVPTLEEQLSELETKYNMPRVIREGILGNPSAYSEFNVNRARDLEDLAKKIRDLKEGK